MVYKKCIVTINISDWFPYEGTEGGYLPPLHDGFTMKGTSIQNYTQKIASVISNKLEIWNCTAYNKQCEGNMTKHC